MPQYEYFCHACKKAFSKVLTLAEYQAGKAFSKVLTLAEYQAGKVARPNCSSKKVEQTVVSFYSVTSKKSA